MTESLNYQLLLLSGLIQLQNRAREAGLRELEFLIVNETHSLLPYRQAALWYAGEDRNKIGAVSGAAAAERGAPYIIWLEKLADHLAKQDKAQSLHVIAKDELPKAIAEEWATWFPSEAIWIPLPAPEGKLSAALILARPEVWGEGDRQILSSLAGTYAQTLYIRRQLHQTHRLVSFLNAGRKKHTLRIAAVALLLAIFPIHQSVLAPAEIVPVSPALVRAPFDGVVDQIAVTPNQAVHKGDRLLSLDTRQIKTRYDVAAKALDMARAEYNEVAQEALTDSKVKGRLSILQGKIDEQAAEADYAKGMLDRADIASPADGVVIMEDPTGWIGKPVALGERIMLVASPASAELEIQVPVASITRFAKDADVVFFSNIDPNHAVDAHLTFASYGSSMTPEGVLAYRFRAQFSPDRPPLRLGLKGTAKIYGSYTPLALWVFRRPIALLRQWIAL